VQGFWIGTPKSAAEIAEDYDLYRATTKPRRAAAGKAKAVAAGTVEKSGERPKKDRRVRRARSA
jgi:hypothetical protein